MVRASPGSLGVYEFAGFQFDGGSGELFRLDEGKGTPIALGVRATALLGLLVEFHGKLVSKDAIIDAVWRGRIVEEANLTVQVAALRRVLDREPRGTSLIQTVPGRGYRLVAPVIRLEAPEPPASIRRLVAIVAADVAGYSRLVGEDEEGTLAALQALRQRVIEPTIATHRGRIFKTTGDGLLIEFASVVDAVRCATAVQTQMKAENTALSEERRLVLRIGINLGDVVADGDDILGDGVNIAARLESIAEPGGIVLSASAYEQVRGKVDIDFLDLGDRDLKNIALPVRVYRVARDGPLGASATLLLPDKPSIAVLPFQNMLGNPAQEYFADGMVEEIITALARIRWLVVVARNSSFTYKGQPVDVKRVGRELGVRYVLEGSVRHQANRVRITAQLIDATNGAHIWADRFEGAMEDVFDLQDRVAESVAGVIEPALQAAEIARSRIRPTSDLSAYDAYLRAYAMHLESAAQNAQALELLEHAIALDPRYGPALACAACCCMRMVWDGFSTDPEADTRKIADYARRALQVAGDDPVTIANATIALAHLGEDIGAMIALVKRALTLNPSFARGWHVSSHLKLFAGDIEGAIEDAERALRLSPRSRVGPILCIVGIAQFFARRYDEAVANLLLAIQEEPNHPLPHRALAACYAQMGQLDDARKIIKQLRAVTPLIEPRVVNFRNPEHRDLYLSGLRLAAAEP